MLIDAPLALLSHLIVFINNGRGGVAKDTGENGADQRRLAGAGHTSHGGELPHPKRHIQAVDGAGRDTGQGKFAGCGAGVVVKRELAVGKRAGSWRIAGVFAGGAGIDHFAAALTRERPDVDEPVSLGNEFHVVFHQENGIACVDESAANIQHRTTLGRV